MEEKNYMLFIYGDFKGGEKLAYEIISTLEPVMSSRAIKYIWGDFGIVAHFKTTFPFSELSQYCEDVLNVWVTQYFLLENNGNLYARGEDDNANYLMDLNIEESNQTDEIEDVKDFSDLYKEFMNKLNNGQIEMYSEDEEDYDDEDVDEIELIRNRNTQTEVVSLNDILDKISEKGIESLTKKEKRTLKEYANG